MSERDREPSPTEDTREHPRPLPAESGFFRSLALLFTDPGELNRRASERPTLNDPLRRYGLGAGLGLSLAELFGERGTGALYVFGGGVFGKIAGIGEWIAFVALVPVLAGSLAVVYRGRDFDFHDHLTFSLHFGALVGLGIAAETLLVTAAGGTPLVGPASWAMLLVAAVYYFLFIGDTYGKSLLDMVRGYAALFGVFAVWLTVSVMLYTFTDFTL